MRSSSGTSRGRSIASSSAVAQRLVDERMVGDFARALDVVEARGRIREHALQQVLRVHALQLRGHARAVAVARHRERERGGPAPARLEDRRIEHRLDQRLAHRVRMQVAEHVRRAGTSATSPSDRMMPSSVAAACSSKLKLWQNFLRSARPHARLTRLPNGACSDELHAAALVEEALERRAFRRSARRRARACLRRDTPRSAPRRSAASS